MKRFSIAVVFTVLIILGIGIARALCPLPIQQFYLNVKTDPIGITTIPGQGLYTSGTNVALTAPTYVTVSSNTQYRFNYWDVDGASQGSGVNPITVQMTANHTATAHYVMQYAAVFNQTGLSSDATGTIVTVNSSPETYAQVPFTLWVDNGTSVTYSYSSIVSSSTSGKQFSLSSVTGSSSPITISGPVTITGNYITQYLVTFAETGLDSTANGTIVTVNGSSKTFSTLPYTLWVDNGSSVTYSYSSIVSSSVSGKQFNFTSVTGSSSPISVTGPTNIIGNYETQYYLTVTSSYGSPAGSGWYNNGSSASFSVSTPASGGTGIQYLFSSWTGSGSGSYSGSSASYSVTMDNPITETASWITQYYLTVSSTYSVTSGSGWYNSGSTAYASVASGTVSGGTGIQYVFASWSTGGTNYAQSSGITMNSAITATASWTTQYYLNVSSAHGTLSGAGWYNAGSTASFNVNSPVSGGTGTQYVFTAWSSSDTGGYTGSSASQSVTMNNPITETASWKTQYYLTVSSVYGSPSPESGWFDSGTVITESVTSPVSGGSGVQYVCTGWSGSGSVPASGTASSVTFTISQASTITWSWKTQYQVTFDQTGLDSSASSAVLTVNGNPLTYTQLPYAIWADNGNSIIYSYNNVSSSNMGEQFILMGVTGLSSPITVTNPTTVIGNYSRFTVPLWLIPAFFLMLGVIGAVVLPFLLAMSRRLRRR